MPENPSGLNITGIHYLSYQLNEIHASNSQDTNVQNK